MRFAIYGKNFIIAVSVALALATAPCRAHFLWLKTIEHENEPQAFLFFGENPEDEAYHLPEPLADMQLWQRPFDGERKPLETSPLETGDRVGLIAPVNAKQPYVLEATQPYGVYGTSLLVYYAKHVQGGTPEKLGAAGPSKGFKLDVVPQLKDDQLRLTVSWDGKPLEGAEVKVRAGDSEAVEKKSDDKGQVALKLEKTSGLVSVLANHLEEGRSGEHDGKEYKGVMHYASLTFGLPRARSAEPSPAGQSSSAGIPPLPEPVSSFGAAVADGWLYIYSGHTGNEHEHSAANLSKNFRRIKLGGDGEWEELPMQTPLQGLALVAYDGKVYRVGGLNARNATIDDEEDLHSTAEFAEFEPSTGNWTRLAPLPVPRSSHNAVVIGNRLYVVGGWHLHGESPGDWQSEALVYDFSKPDAAWQKLPQPFKRRALAVGNWQGKLVAIGGMDDNSEISQRVDIFEPQSGKWTQGPDLPGDGMAGFGGAACELDGQIYATGLRGVIYRLNDTGSAWEEATRMATGRFFHQLLPASGGGLLAVGGATRASHLADIELIDIGKTGRRL